MIDSKLAKMALKGVIDELDYLRDIVDGQTFGDLDDSISGVRGRHAGLSTIALIKCALSSLSDELEGDAE